jgi:hypothetical protein
MQAPAQDDPVSEAAFDSGLVALAFVSLTFLASLVVAPTPLAKIRLTWTNAKNNPAGTITEIWASPDLVTWTLKTNVASNSVTLYATNAREFFKIRARGPNGHTSEWSSK